MFKSTLLSIIIVTLIIIADTSSNGRYKSKHMERFSIASRLSDPKSCQNGICENVENYPTDLMDRLTKSHKSLKTFFGTVIEPHKSIVKSRLGFDELENVCVTKTYTVRPRFVQDIYGNHRFIVNTEENQQLIIYETCAFKGEKCFDGPLNKQAYCEQKYSIIKLVALENNQTLSYGRFKIPQTCVCAYQETCVTGDC